MEFPLSYTYRYTCLYRAEPEALLKQYESSLMMEGARDVRRNGPSLAFNGAAFVRGGGWRYSPLQLVTDGTFEVSRVGTQTEIKATVSFVESAFYLLLASLMAIAVPGLFTAGPRLSLAALTAAGWVAMVSAFYWFASKEFEALVRRVEQSSVQSPRLG